MRSIPLALTWELLSRGRWILLAGALGGTAFPLIVLAALESDGALNPADPSFLVMHVVMIQLNLAIFGAAVVAAQGSPSRLFAFPAPNSTIVTWQMLPAMVITVIQSAASTAFLNAVFDLGWPLWGPAFFVAALLAAVLAVSWLLDKSMWMPFSVGLAALVLGVWFKSRYGDPFTMPRHYWRTITPAEAATLLGFAALAYLGALAGVTRNRRGEAPASLGVVAWLERLWEATPSADRTFAAPERAQSWFEWRQKGWAMPVTVAFGMVFGLTLWAIFSRNPEELFGGMATGGIMLAIAALVGGMVVGNTSPKDSMAEMSSFLATRPISTTDLARIILKTAGWSIFLAWLLWAAAFCAVYAILWETDRLPGSPEVPWSWWYLPASLLGAWTVLALSASVGLMGRPYLLVKVLCSLLFGYIGLVLLSRFTLTYEGQLQLGRVATIGVSIAFILLAAWAFFGARRRGLIGWPTVYVAASVWIGLAAVVVLAWTQHVLRMPEVLLLIAFAALSVAPLATAPLALAWNRNR